MNYAYMMNLDKLCFGMLYAADGNCGDISDLYLLISPFI